jgi:helix-turn-helix protein
MKKSKDLRETDARPHAPQTVYHEPGDCGPRSKRYPEINIALTAAAHGMSKSQLSRLLNGQNRPSMKSLRVLVAVLGKSLEEVMEIYGKETGAVAGSRKGKRTRGR